MRYLSSIINPIPSIVFQILRFRLVQFISNGHCPLVIINLLDGLLYFQHLAEFLGHFSLEVGHRLHQYQHLSVKLMDFFLELMLLLKETTIDFVDVCQHLMLDLLLIQQFFMEPF